MDQARRVLADGQAPTTIGVIYRSPRENPARVDQVRVFNTNAATQTVVLALNVNGTNRQYSRVVLGENQFADMLDKPLELDARDALLLVTTTAGALDYVVTGHESQ